MKHRACLVIIASMVILSFAPWETAAQEPGMEETALRHQYLSEQTVGVMMRALDLPGSEILDGTGERLGTVEDLLFDPYSAFMLYASVLFEEGPGEPVPVPLEVLVPDPQSSGFTLPISDREVLTRAPSLSGQPRESAGVSLVYREISQFWLNAIDEISELRVPPGTGRRDEPGLLDRDMETSARLLTGDLMSITGVENVPILDRTGERFAEVEDILFSLVSGTISFLLISETEGGALIPVPLGVLYLDADEERFILGTEEASLAEAPRFQPGEEPDFSDVEWNRTVLAWWTDVDIQAGTTFGLHLYPAGTYTADMVLDTAVRDTRLRQIGVVEDFIITSSGDIPYVILSSGGLLGLGADEHPVPTSALPLDPFRRILYLDLSEELLDELPRVESLRLPAHAEAWDEEVRQAWEGIIADAAGSRARAGFLAERKEGTAGAARLSTLIGQEVGGNRNGSAGEITDVMVDPITGTVSGYILESEGREFTLEPDSLAWNFDESGLILTLREPTGPQ